LQVAAYREKAQAQKLADKLRAGKLPAVRIVKSEVPGKGTYWRVRLGNFARKEEADTYRRKLAVEMALDAMVVKQQ
ncbi:MAG: SPOR domain-containing protein, partial [Deltaproteobacteria bacterium]